MKTKIISLIFFILISIACLSQNNKYIGTPFITNYLSKEYNAHNQNFAIVKDKRGVIYFANGSGVLEFDGINWRIIVVENNYSVRSLAVDNNGVIYVGAFGSFGYLAPDSIGTMQYHSISKQLDTSVIKKSPNIWRIKIANNQVFFNAFDALYKYKPYKDTDNIFEKINVYYPPKRFFLSCVVDETYYIQELSKGLCVIEGDSLKPIFSFEELSLQVVFSMVLNKKNPDEIIIALQSKLLKYRPKADTIKGEKILSDYKTEADSFFAKNKIYDLIKLPDNNLAIATLGKGIIVVNQQGKILDYINMQNNLQDDAVTAMLFVNNSLWLALNNGISQVEIPSPFRIWNSTNLLKGSVQNILNYKNNLYLASSNGLYYYNTDFDKKNASIPTFERIESQVNETRCALSFVNQNNFDTTLLVGQSYFLSVVGAKKPIMREITYCMLQSKLNPDIVYAGGKNKLYILKQEQKSKLWQSKTIENFASGINTIVEINNLLWISTDGKGLYRIEIEKSNNFFNSIENTEIKHYDTVADSKIISHIFEVEDKAIFFASGEMYKYVAEKDSFVTYNKFGNVFQEQKFMINKFIQNKNGDVWVNNHGILYKQKDKTYFFDSIFYKRIPMKFKGIFPYKNLWYAAGADGMLQYNRKSDYNYQQKFNTIIRKVTINTDSLIFNGANYNKNDSLNINIVSLLQPNSLKPSIEYKFNTINFSYASLYYISQKTTKYSYKLVGFDKKWSSWTDKTEKEYTNLPEGNYVFKVKAKNIYGFESEIGTYEFEILPPWYRTWWAYILYLMLSILLIVVIVKLSLRRVIKAKIKLEKIVKERTIEILQQNEEIQTQADNLKEFNEELYQQNEEIQTQADNLKEFNEELYQQKEEISTQNENLKDAYNEINDKNFELNEKNEHITASVRYAKTIQTATLPFEERIKKQLDLFILFRPKDIVSGDFYWFTYMPAKDEFLEKKFIAAVDCTGHGVPGAFMSMIGMQLLNKIVNEDKITSPADILLQLHNGIYQSLKQATSDNTDGMDVCLCCIESAENQQFKIIFSGAKRPLYYFEKDNNKLTRIKGDRKTIGGKLRKNSLTHFSNKEIVLQKNDLIYLSSDGYIDQNNKERKRFGTKNFEILLNQLANKPLIEQKQILETELDNWQAKEKQRDDITVVGIKL